jgi:hypothetical protein
MFGRGKKQEPSGVGERPSVGFVEISGVGKVEVSSTPETIPSRIQVGDKWVKVDRELYKYLWALSHATSEGRKKLDSLV